MSTKLFRTRKNSVIKICEVIQKGLEIDPGDGQFSQTLQKTRNPLKEITM